MILLQTFFAVVLLGISFLLPLNISAEIRGLAAEDTVSVVYRGRTYDCLQAKRLQFGRTIERDGQLIFRSSKRKLKLRIRRALIRKQVRQARKIRQKLKTIQRACRQELSKPPTGGSPVVPVPQPPGPTPGDTPVTGELRKWHKLTLDFAGPQSSETAAPNPFTDYRLNVIFTHSVSGVSYRVPGYYAADGAAAETSAVSGNIWRVHFAPPDSGVWRFVADFRSGRNVAVDQSAGAGASAGYFDGQSGRFTVGETNKTGRDLRAKGLLQYVGKHYLQFAENGEYFVKAGVDAPENLLAYEDFDGDFKTDGQKDNLIKTYTAHVSDWRTGDPVWQGSRGKGLIGAINYLAAQGLNAFSFLTMNINGDDRNVFPYLDYQERRRMDISRLDQWERVFEHGTKSGMYLHFKTQETENQKLLNDGDLGVERKLYYRELIARFSHHLALNWNLGEETSSASYEQKAAWADYFYRNDPYKHHIVIHNYPNRFHEDLMGDRSALSGFSVQTGAANFTDVFEDVDYLVRRSVSEGKPYVIAVDEPGDAQLALRPDSDPGNSHVDARKHVIWGSILAGGAGFEYYFGYRKEHSDLTLQDFRSRDSFWKYNRYLLEFLAATRLNLTAMTNQNYLISNAGENKNRVFAQAGEAYLIQLPNGGFSSLDLTGHSSNFRVDWFDPRSGGALIPGGTIRGGSKVGLGNPPSAASADWIILVRSQ